MEFNSGIRNCVKCHIPFLFLFLITVWHSGYAQYTDVDLRTTLEGNKNYVGIAIRDNTHSGHAFVILGRQNPQKQMSEISIQGFYPVHNGTPVDDGQVKNDFKS